jgi:hypothetical protein
VSLAAVQNRIFLAEPLHNPIVSKSAVQYSIFHLKFIHNVLRYLQKPFRNPEGLHQPYVHTAHYFSSRPPSEPQIVLSCCTCMYSTLSFHQNPSMSPSAFPPAPPEFQCCVFISLIAQCAFPVPVCPLQGPV